LLFDVFKQAPVVSMPDFYWVTGSISLLIAFTTFFVYMYKQHGGTNRLWSLLISGIIILGIVVGYVYSLNLSGFGENIGHFFLGYFYPIVSSLILISSLGVYLFQEKLDQFRNDLLLLFIANIAFLLGDVLYTYLTISGGYGVAGMASDIMYITAYSLCSLSFYLLLGKTVNTDE